MQIKSPSAKVSGPVFNTVISIVQIHCVLWLPSGMAVFCIQQTRDASPRWRVSPRPNTSPASHDTELHNVNGPPHRRISYQLRSDWLQIAASSSLRYNWRFLRHAIHMTITLNML